MNLKPNHRRLRRSLRQALLWGPVAATLAVFGGCAFLEQLVRVPERPTARIVGVELSRLTFESVELTAELELSNPNTFNVRLDRLEYALEIDEARPVAGRQERQLNLPAGGSTTTDVGLSLRYADLFASAQAVSNRNETPYRVELTPGFDIPGLGPVDLELSWEGTIPVLHMPSIRVAGLTLESIGFTGAEIAVAFDIDNPNMFRLDPSRLDYILEIDGRRVSEGGLTDSQPISAESTSRRSVLVGLNFLETGDAVRRVITGSGAVPYRFSGELRFDLGMPLIPETVLPYDIAGDAPLRR